MRVRLADDVRRYDGGRLLVGGSPLIAQRLRRPAEVTDADSTVGRRWLASGLGTPVLDDVPTLDPALLTVIVPVRDHPVDVAALHPLRVVVVDDASTRPVPGALRLPENRGPAGARNAGLAEVTTPFVAFVDADVTATAADLLALTRHFADPAVALVAPRVRGRSDAVRPVWWQRYDAAFSDLDLGPVGGPVRPGARVSYLPSACLVARRADLGDGFDERLRTGEDVDLVWRLVGADRIVRYDPSIVVGHGTRGSAAAWLSRIADYGTSAAPLAQRHGSAVAPAVTSPAFGLAALALLARNRWSLPLAAASVGLGMRRLRPLPAGAAAEVSVRGLGWAVRQEASLAVRHWWPAALAASVVSRRARRVVASALVVDSAVALADRRGLDALTRLAGRRLTDLAYGAGVWAGVVRARSARALLPRAR